MFRASHKKILVGEANVPKVVKNPLVGTKKEALKKSSKLIIIPEGNST